MGSHLSVQSGIFGASCGVLFLSILPLKGMMILLTASGLAGFLSWPMAVEGSPKALSMMSFAINFFLVSLLGIFVRYLALHSFGCTILEDQCRTFAQLLYSSICSVTSSFVW